MNDQKPDFPPGHPLADGPGLGAFMPQDAEIPDGPIRSGAPLPEGVTPATEEAIIKGIKTVYDPEIPVNIVDLGLIYDLKIDDGDEGKKISVKMTLTAQGCGMGPVIADDAKQRILALSDVESAEVDIVWDPPWTPRMISEEGKKVLGLE